MRTDPPLPPPPTILFSPSTTPQVIYKKGRSGRTAQAAPRSDEVNCKVTKRWHSKNRSGHGRNARNA